MNIEIHEYSKPDLDGSTAIVSFPTIGMIGTIVTNYLVSSRKMEMIGDISFEEMLPVIIIRDGSPILPVRIYAGDISNPKTKESVKVALITSDVPLRPDQFSPFADRVIEWCEQKGIKRIITLEGYNTDREIDEKGKIKIYSVGSLPTLNKRIEHLPVEHLDTGMLSGISGFLLYRGKIRDFHVYCFLTEAYSQFPDSRSAAATINVLNKMFCDLELDPKPLLQEADRIESEIKDAMSQLRTSFKNYGKDYQGMYR